MNFYPILAAVLIPFSLSIAQASPNTTAAKHISADKRPLSTPNTGIAGSADKGDPAPDDARARLIQGKKRSLLAYAGDTHSFTMEIVARSVKPSDVPGFVTIDNQIVQSTLVPVSKSIDLRQPTVDKQKTALTKYMNYELEYYKKKLKQNYTHLQTEWITLQGRLFLLWYFDMPENYKLVSRQVYASTIFFDQVVDINAPVFKINDGEKARNLVLKLAGAMKTYDQRLDLEALHKKLLKN